MLLDDGQWSALHVEDVVLEDDDADDKVRDFPKTSIACFSTGGEAAAIAPGGLASGKPSFAAPASADIEDALESARCSRQRSRCSRERCHLIFSTESER